MARLAVMLLCALLAASEARLPRNDDDLRSWLQNMVWYHRFSAAEMIAATGLEERDLAEALARFGIKPENRPKRPPDAPLRVLPYPGGRHPRVGFLEGAINPQRETKVSVFTPWDETSYVVVDLPEAIFSNLGLIYLAHTHVPTLWTERGINLEKLEWNRPGDGSLDVERRLPNEITFGARVVSGRDGVRMELWLVNKSKSTLTGLRVQNCVMLKGATGFDSQSNDNKRFEVPFAICRSKDGHRWIITAWERCGRAWGNSPCPCIHSDPTFADCPPGETRRLHGWLSFYEGTDIEAELRRITPLMGFPSGAVGQP